MKIFQINSTCGSGSTGNIAVDIYKKLEENGNSGIIAFGRGNSPEYVNSYKIGNDFDVKMHGVLSRITDRQGFFSKNATKMLIEKIKSFSPDIIHLHNIHGYYLNVKLLFEFLKDYKKPVVWTLHDCWAFTGHCAYFTFADCNKWMTQCYNCPQKKSYPSSLVLDNSKKNYIQKKQLFTSLENVHLVTPSDWLKQTVEQSFLNKYSVTRIYNGIDLNVFQNRKSNFKEENGIKDKKIVLGVANIWEKRKGLDDFIKLSEMISDDFIIVLVGLNDKQISKLPDKILGLKRTENAVQLAQIYSAADVYVNASVEETMGLTTVEALACGTPAVVYNSTAIPEVIDEKSGIVVETNNVKSLYDAVLKISKNPEDCLNRAKMFNKDNCYDEYMSLYEKVLNG